HGVVAGPTLKKLTPASATSRSASAPDGVVPPRGGPFASTIGKTFVPFTSTVPLESRLVTVAPADAAEITTATTADTATAACLIALQTLPSQPALDVPNQGTAVFFGRGCPGRAVVQAAGALMLHRRRGGGGP